MMIANTEPEHRPTITKKPSRFNLGGLIRKKITWKKSIDALASSVGHVQLDYNADDIAADAAPPPLTTKDSVRIPPLNPHIYASAYTSVLPEQALRQQSDSLELPSTLLAVPEDRYTACHTECISLQNSEMTSAMTSEHDDRESLEDSDLIFSLLLKPREDEYIPYDASLEESIAEYRPGGYHPVRIGDTYTSDLNRYKVIQKLGWGHFSTVWLCVSLMTGEFVAMKIVKLGANYADAARDEISILRILQGEDEDEFAARSQQNAAHIVELRDNFQISGPNGTHLVMVFELMGENLLHLIYSLRASRAALAKSGLDFSPSLMPMAWVKHVTRQVLQSVHYMHQRGVIHTDLKPENILLAHSGLVLDSAVVGFRSTAKFQVCPSSPLKTNLDHLDESNLHVKIADLGNATHAHMHFTNNIQTRQYRAPEIVLKHERWGSLADVWSIACLAFELLTGDYLFEPKTGASFCKDEDHLAQMIELMGEFPTAEYLLGCELAYKFFVTPRTLKNISTLKFWSLKNVLVEKYKLAADDPELALFCDFMSKCLRLDISQRYDCGSLLAHPWFREGAEFNQQECDELPNNNCEIPGFTCED